MSGKPWGEGEGEAYVAGTSGTPGGSTSVATSRRNTTNETRAQREGRHARLFILCGGLTGNPDVRPYTGPEGAVDALLLAADVRLLIEEAGLCAPRAPKVDDGDRGREKPVAKDLAP